MKLTRREFLSAITALVAVPTLALARHPVATLCITNTGAVLGQHSWIGDFGEHPTFCIKCGRRKGIADGGSVTDLSWLTPADEKHL